MFDEKINLEKEGGEKMIKNTAEFRESLEKGELEKVENFLNEVASQPDKYPQYDDRWLDHRQRELFQAFYGNEDWAGAKRIVEATKDPISKDGRKKRLEELSGKKYEEI
jgi:hypothetical protein